MEINLWNIASAGGYAYSRPWMLSQLVQWRVESHHHCRTTLFPPIQKFTVSARHGNSMESSHPYFFHFPNIRRKLTQTAFYQELTICRVDDSKRAAMITLILTFASQESVFMYSHLHNYHFHLQSAAAKSDT